MHFGRPLGSGPPQYAGIRSAPPRARGARPSPPCPGEGPLVPTRANAGRIVPETCPPGRTASPPTPSSPPGSAWTIGCQRARPGTGAAPAEEGHERADFVIVASGPHGASPHHGRSDRVVRAGEPVVVDIGGPAPSGHFSDSTLCNRSGRDWRLPA
ncbi:MAG: M24 family metallopeptidase [Propionibacterium acidifaciens]|uniref:M24 family metallopeptidase n=1 Tax=Propionibacterium acidifaciens TaxID=556499 RepID=UPI003607CAF0